MFAPNFYLGSPALSEFRCAKRLATAQHSVPSLHALYAQYLYLIDSPHLLDITEQQRLDALLHGTLSPPQPEMPSGQHRLVIPRPGTSSPWSSKATDIVKCCGLDKIKRVERGVLWTLIATPHLSESELLMLDPLLHDRMTEVVLPSLEQADCVFSSDAPRPLHTIPLLDTGESALHTANQQLGLALSDDEIAYLLNHFQAVQRNPTDVELMMFAQANSEHCRHKIFNADWVLDGEPQTVSLFQMIRQTHAANPGQVVSAYHDNAAVINGFTSQRLQVNSQNRQYTYCTEDTGILMKVETHNHPTAISPKPGASTGAGGEIRDEGATGCGAKPKAGLTGFSVSHLHIPDRPRPWETSYGKPERIASALQIMLEAPIGASGFNNEFGRPALCGYFRSFEQTVNGQRRGYHKPIMIAGGVGNIRPQHIAKDKIQPDCLLIVLGGPAMLIGLGGGAASSVATGHSDAELDFASVQRDNPEMQRRCQEVINACWQMGADNPILSLHDVGAGGLSNALPELVNGSGCGGLFDLSKIPSADPSLSPMELWCNEAQERYVLGIAVEQLPLFKALCQRERCPYAVVGQATAAPQLTLQHAEQTLIDMPLAVLLGKPPKMQRIANRVAPTLEPLDYEEIQLREAALRVLQHPTVGDKSFLITIADRSVGGLTVRDPLVGPWQVPVADCAVTASSFHDDSGEAMAMGERTPLAVINAPAAGRMAVGEALTNLAAAYIEHIEDIVLSANWMAACGEPSEDAALFDTVQAVSKLCQTLGIAIPVGKDSLSMRTVWDNKAVTAPLSLIVSAFAPVTDVRDSLTPHLSGHHSVLLLVDIARGQQRLGGSILAQTYEQIGTEAPDVDHPTDLKAFFMAIQALNQQEKLLAYHDRSDGGLFVTLCEMAFASHCGLEIHLDKLGPDALAALFNEELGAVLEIPKNELATVQQWFADYTDLGQHIYVLGNTKNNDMLNFYRRGAPLLSFPRVQLHKAWSETSYHLQRLRDNPVCADQAYESIADTQDPGLTVDCTFTPAAPTPTRLSTAPKIAILREQGVNGQAEMAAAFMQAGFSCVDVHMSDILSGRVTLQDFQGLAACGGFSYGDVLGAGGGWAKSIRFNARAFDEFSAFFQRSDSFALGVCNGCQMLAQLHDLIPGADHWGQFIHNHSEQFEARVVMVEVVESPSLFFAGMAGSRIPVVVSHGEGRLHCSEAHPPEQLMTQELVSLRYVDNNGAVTMRYPFNPNGSPLGITGLTNTDGRFTILMPHPERVFLAKQFSWLPDEWEASESPWMQLFWNARRWVG